MLSEDKPVICFFHRQKEDAQVSAIKTVLAKFEKELPLLPVYEFITDESPENQELCEIVEIVDRPVLIIYKNGCFSRYKDKLFTEKSISMFIGSKSTYQPKQSTKATIEVDV